MTLGNAHTHLTLMYVNSISPNTLSYERTQPSVFWKWLSQNVCFPVLSHLSSSSDIFDKAEQEIYPFNMEHFAREAEFWSKLMVSWMKYSNIKGIILGIFLVAFHKIKMNEEFIIKGQWSCSLF